MTNLIETFMSRKEDYAQALVEHIQLSLLSLLIAILIAVPVAVLLTRYKRIAEAVLQITGIFQTIPSLALLGLLIPLIGIGSPPAIIALVMYALFPILQNTYTGLTEIDPSLEEAAEAFGMSKKEKLVKFELQLALPYVISGIRTAAVMIIGTATLAALIGAGGLGSFILLGIDRNNVSLILIGAISSAVLAVLFNYGIHLLEKASVKKIVTAFVLLFALLVGSFVYTTYEGEQKRLTIAGKLGAEPDIIINMYRELIEENSDVKVELKPNFGKTTFLYNALKSGEIDIYPEFSGTVLETFLPENTNTSNDPEEVYEYARDEIAKQDNLAYLEPMSYQNTYAVAVKRSFAEEYKLKTIEDLKGIASQLKAGFTLEFIDRDDGYKGIEKLYGVTMSVQSMEPSLRYQAIDNGDVNVVDAYSTDSELKQYDLVVLEDNKQLFPPYQGAPLLREETLEEYPELEEWLSPLVGKITEEEMSEMNYKVNVEGQDPQEVAHMYLVENELINE
ncbi:ABC transporter permease/substrate-binding protein [Enterococcus sp. BWB1-3]|uniref:ABC transporter permease/substrate-binding protein n=1 Tax=unclassified Enterococcus TaxID=2608891 RepID=UPI00192201B5|nr:MULTISPECIES: ABC transporter permease/substrate-binding protein [unclassified Enterococcus]MBL1228698.1 ABC transporter permease/substrate-binding protein [Enterococcus sp. BWB1-3]MCB5952770.1 ABC transporter permease/substrate-binding protein [Enterococcus sp. BWT-B8]MCB5953688.1 ABC transporter permease/substrate-binding protein [Enterococcus sp. CWB-B31]